MPLIITPGQLKRRAELYHTLGVLLGAGLTAPQALQQLHRNPPSRSQRAPIAQLQEHLRQGHSVGAAVAKLGSWMPAFDAALVDAGDRSGRLDACFKLLAVHYEERAQMARQMISDLAYPVGLFHFAVLVFAFIGYVMPGHGQGNATLFWLHLLVPLVPVYALTLFLLFACQGRRGPEWRSWLESVLRPVPLLGAARRSLALARLAAALEALLSAGILITSAWEMAAAASGSPALGRAVRGWKAAVESGSAPAELIKQSGEFPELFASLYSSGEISGQLDESLTRLHTIYQEEGTRKMRQACVWAANLVKWAVMLLAAFVIVSSWMRLYGPGSDLDNILNGK
ncbi:MAG: type II secretion system F family protein [Verrucomicrobiota bacterium]|jgi:type II secretory pathway component PulF